MIWSLFVAEKNNNLFFPPSLSPALRGKYQYLETYHPISEEIKWRGKEEIFSRGVLFSWEDVSPAVYCCRASNVLKCMSQVRSVAG